jgi:hypothetical protein
VDVGSQALTPICPHPPYEIPLKSKQPTILLAVVLYGTKAELSSYQKSMDSVLKTEATASSVTLLHAYQTARWHNAADNKVSILGPFENRELRTRVQPKCTGSISRKKENGKVYMGDTRGNICFLFLWDRARLASRGTPVTI